VSDDTHGCPGCGAPVARHQLACKPDWYRLPKPLRDAINSAYRHRERNPAAHRAALGAAMRWYRANPGGGS
jgi:hypothetical protein